jgi:hypothetical protein
LNFGLADTNLADAWSPRIKNEDVKDGRLIASVSKTF